MQKEKNTTHIAPFILTLMLFLSSGILSQIEAGVPRAINGILDLRGWNFVKQGPIKLSGNWKFYKGMFLEPEDFINTGSLPPYEIIPVPEAWNNKGGNFPRQYYGTYRLVVLLDPQKEDLGLRIKDIGYSYKIFVNGSILARSGVPGKTKDTSEPQHKPQTADFMPEGRNQEIIIQMSNFYNRGGGIWDDIILGTDTQTEESRNREIYYTLFFFGAIFIIGIYHLILYCFRKKDASVLVFSALCLIAALRTLVTGEYFIVNLIPGIWWEAINKMEYLTYFLGVAAFCLFIYIIFNKEFSRLPLRIILVISALFSIITTLTPLTIYIWLIDAFDVLIIFIGLYVLYVIALATIRKRFGAIILLVGSVIIFFAVINDVLYTNEFIDTAILAPLGLFLFVLSQSFVMSMRYARSFNEVELLSDELEIKSQDLEQKNIRLTELDRIKDEYLASTSHEIRSPIDGISGLTENMLDGVSGPLNQSQTEHLRMILGSSKRLSRLVNDIMDLTRIRQGDIFLDIKTVDVRSAVDMVLNMYKPLISAKGLRLIDNIEELPEVSVDEDRFQQIIHNLLSNAVKYTKEGEIEISAYREGTMVAMSVRDTGTGIPNDIKESIFMWGEKETSGKKKGLGLALTKKLIEIQKGSIRVESTQGKGSIFTFTLPVAPQTVPKESKSSDKVQDGIQFSDPSVAESGASGIRVLAVDDDAISLRLMTDTLIREGFSVIALESGEEALERLKHHVNVDVVLLDVMMPRMSGFEVCKEIRKEFRVNELPILFLMSKGQNVDIREAFEIGVNDYITKPFSKYELSSRIRFHVNLCRSSNELRHLKDNLSVMVRERTKELEAALEELANANEALKDLSLMDGLTGVRNRRFFNDRFKIEWERALRERYPISVLMIDIDCFKNINDSYGHLVGDECLKEVASVIKSSIERSSDEVVRYGGEEFVVTLFNTPKDGAFYLADKVRMQIEEIIMYDNDRKIPLTVSIGVATLVPPGKDNPEQLVALADDALYDAKRSGRNRVCVSRKDL
jgi:two-component system, sensor histidine kinase ChiS